MDLRACVLSDNLTLTRWWRRPRTLDDSQKLACFVQPQVHVLLLTRFTCNVYSVLLHFALFSSDCFANSNPQRQQQEKVYAARAFVHWNRIGHLPQHQNLSRSRLRPKVKGLQGTNAEERPMQEQKKEKQKKKTQQTKKHQEERCVTRKCHV